MTILDTYLDAHVAILGATGGGKSYTARGLVERLLGAGRRVCILDPVGVWWGLKANASGDGPGMSVAVIGGEHGDLRLSEGMGEPLARAVAANNLPVVVDTSEMGVGERNRFLKSFLAELYRVNKAALWLVLEEADEAAPQQPRSDGAPQLLDAVDRIARRGRSRGFRLIVVSQRPQVIHKNVLTQIRTMIAHRLGAPLDIKAVEEWMKANSDPQVVRQVVATLPSLETGEAWIWNPEARHLSRERMPEIATFDSSRTPSADEAHVEPVGLAEIDLGPFKAALRVTEDSREVKVGTKKVSQMMIEAADRAGKIGYDAGRKFGFERGYNEGYAAGRVAEAELWKVAVTPLVNGEVSPAPTATLIKNPYADAPRRITDAKSAPHLKPAPLPVNGMPASAAKILAVLDTNPPIRMSWSAACAMNGNKARGGHFNSTRKWLVDNSMVIEDGNLIRIVQPTAAAPAPQDGTMMRDSLRDAWRSILGGRPAQIISVLENGPMTKTDIATVLGCAAHGGHWNGAWKALRDNDLIVVAGGTVGLKGELA